MSNEKIKVKAISEIKGQVAISIQDYNNIIVENFALASNQCHAGYANLGGGHSCAYQDCIKSLNVVKKELYSALRDVADELPAQTDELGYTITLTQVEVDAIRAALAKADGEHL